MCIYAQDMKFLWLDLLLGGLSTDDTNDDNNDANDDNDATWQTIHDCIDSSAISKWANNWCWLEWISVCILTNEKAWLVNLMNNGYALL